MASKEFGLVWRALSRGKQQQWPSSACTQCRRYASTEIPKATETASPPAAAKLPEDALSSFDPVARTRSRVKQLPPSRYRFRNPRYYRGPMHPVQPLPPTDPASREFVPGPFSLPRLQQTYESTIEPDLMAIMYTHYPPGFKAPPRQQRLREWIGDSPYFKNRPLRGPRGGGWLTLRRQPITFRNVPKVEGVTVHTFQSQAMEDSAYVHVAGMLVQAITNVRVTTHKSKNNVAQWGLRANKYSAVTADLEGEDALHFISKVVDMVLPRIKDWRGVKGTSGDSSGNITFGLDPDAVALFPEVEVNYDQYPPKMIPGCHITIKTSARNDTDGRVLCTALGLPFYGKLHR